jgi:hypothetical protein
MLAPMLRYAIVEMMPVGVYTTVNVSATYVRLLRDVTMP